MRTFVLHCIVAAIAICGPIAPSAKAADTKRSSLFHRCVNAALAAKPGQVLEVDEEREGGRSLYEIDILGNDGRRWELKCDMSNARIISIERDRDDDSRAPRAERYGEERSNLNRLAQAGADRIDARPDRTSAAPQIYGEAR